MCPGARSNPGRLGDSVPKQPMHDTHDDARVRGKTPVRASTKIVGPEE
jgi:hypothetical protein